MFTRDILSHYSVIPLINIYYLAFIPLVLDTIDFDYLQRTLSTRCISIKHQMKMSGVQLFFEPIRENIIKRTKMLNKA